MRAEVFAWVMLTGELRGDVWSVCEPGEPLTASNIVQGSRLARRLATCGAQGIACDEGGYYFIQHTTVDAEGITRRIKHKVYCAGSPDLASAVMARAVFYVQQGLARLATLWTRGEELCR
jgi:hypothetical protein